MLSSLSVFIENEYKAMYKREQYLFSLKKYDYSFFRNFYDINNLLKNLNSIVLKSHIIYNQVIFIKNGVIEEEINRIEHIIIKKILFYYGYSKIFLEYLEKEKILFSDNHKLNIEEFDKKLFAFLLDNLIEIKISYI